MDIRRERLVIGTAQQIELRKASTDIRNTTAQIPRILFKAQDFHNLPSGSPKYTLKHLGHSPSQVEHNIPQIKYPSCFEEGTRGGGK